MNPASHQALVKLAAFGMEELSSSEAAQLLSAIEQCPECAGEWILFHKTICQISESAPDVLSGDCSQKMWLVCLEHAKQKHAFEITSDSGARPNSHTPKSAHSPLHAEVASHA